MRSVSPLRPWLLPMLALLSIAGESYAEGPAQPVWSAPLQDSLSGDAKTAYEAGRLLAAADDFTAAYARFKLAYEKSRDPRLLWNMAAMQKSLHHYSNAHYLLRRYLKEGGTRLTQDERRDVEALLKNLETVTARLHLKTNVPAVVSIDDHVIAEMPSDSVIPLEAGHHRVQIESKGHRPFASELDVEGHEDITASVELRRPDDPAVACSHTTASWIPSGRLIVRARAKTRISIDGEPAGEGHIECVLSAGPHEVKVGIPATTVFRETVTIQPNATFTIQGKHALSMLAEDGPAQPVNDAPVPTDEHPKGCGCWVLRRDVDGTAALTLLLAALTLAVARARRRT